MDRAILLTKLAKSDNTDSKLYKCYMNAIQDVIKDEIEAFEQYIADLKLLSDIQYDFAALTELAKEFGITRKDYRDLCDTVCVLIGDKINELCKYSKNGIVTKPAKYEEYCPFSSEELVIYGNKGCSYMKHDGIMYEVVDTKLETSPYYTIYCSKLDR